MLILQEKTKQFIKIGAIFTVVLGLLHFALFEYILKEPYLAIYPILFLYFLAFSVVVVNFIIKSTESRPASFVNAFLISVTVKMLLSLTLIVAYIYASKAQVIPVLLTFLFTYLLYLSLEVIFLVRNLKK